MDGVLEGLEQVLALAAGTTNPACTRAPKSETGGGDSDFTVDEGLRVIRTMGS